MVVGDVTTAVDVLVLGAGPGGYIAAIRAAQLGHHVTLVDQGPPGGTCLLRGCIPLKALLSATERYAQARSEDLASMGIHAESVSFDWPSMQAWKQSVVDRLVEGVRRLVSGNHIDYVQGIGWFINNQEVRVEGEYGSHRFKFEHCILAVGADPTVIPGFSYDGKQILTPEQALALPELPATLAISGDDYIALELALRNDLPETTYYARKLEQLGTRAGQPHLSPGAVDDAGDGHEKLAVSRTLLTHHDMRDLACDRVDDDVRDVTRLPVAADRFGVNRQFAHRVYLRIERDLRRA